MRFDRIIAVDGSAASRPVTGRDSMWIATASRGRSPVELINPATRSVAFDALAASCVRPGRTLLVVDWSLGYPAGTAAAFDLEPPDRADRRGAWTAMWEHLSDRIVDDPDNRNNRFEVAADLNARVPSAGPFWGAPARSATDALTVTKQPFVEVAEWRAVELRLRARRRWPSSCWQLGGAGAVGSQSLVGIARLARLRDELLARARQVAVWPFETGLRAPDDDVEVVIAECWPPLYVANADLPIDRVRDAAQVDAVVRALSVADSSGDLERWFAPDVPAEQRTTVRSEEGWILAPPVDEW